MNVCLKARDSQSEPLDADTGSEPVSWKLAHYLFPGYLGLFRRGFVRFRLQFSVLLEQDFNFALRLFQFFAAGSGELNALFKELQGVLEGHIAFLELIHNLF